MPVIDNSDSLHAMIKKALKEKTQQNPLSANQTTSSDSKNNNLSPLTTNSNQPSQATKDVDAEFDLERRGATFLTGCRVQNRLITHLAIAGGCIENFVSTAMVRELNLPVTPHPAPYERVTSQCHILLSIEDPFCIGGGGLYCAEVLCSVVDMDEAQIVLGCPWLNDTDAIHHGPGNCYVLMHKGLDITLLPLHHLLISNSLQEDWVLCLINSNSPDWDWVLCLINSNSPQEDWVLCLLNLAKSFSMF